MEKKRRALVLMGAGASIDFGASSTADLTQFIEEKILTEKLTQNYAADCAWLKIKHILTNYYKEEVNQCNCQNLVNFEHIYHCAHELISTFQPTSPYVSREHRPVLIPFMERRINTNGESLKLLIRYIVRSIQEKISTACENPNGNFYLLEEFIRKLQNNYITRIYTTNYDNFILQASSDLYTGFDSNHESGSRRFNRENFWNHFNQHSVFHLHGSIHLNFGRPSRSDADFGDFYWYDSPREALQHRDSVSDMQNMDGGSTIRTPIITGLDKLSPLQQMPFSYYYSCLSRDAMAADIIYVIGYGLGDLHINMWLKQARWRNPKPPLLFISRWRNSFEDVIRNSTWSFDSSSERSKEIKMIHTLYMKKFRRENYSQGIDNWHFDREFACAIWSQDFLGFLRASNHSDQLDSILGELR